MIAQEYYFALQFKNFANVRRFAFEKKKMLSHALFFITAFGNYLAP